MLTRSSTKRAAASGAAASEHNQPASPAASETSSGGLTLGAQCRVLPTDLTAHALTFLDFMRDRLFRASKAMAAPALFRISRSH